MGGVNEIGAANDSGLNQWTRRVAEMRAFAAKDLFHHRVIASLEGAPTHDCLAFNVSRALRKEDSYEAHVVGLRAGDGAPAHVGRIQRELSALEFRCLGTGAPFRPRQRHSAATAVGSWTRARWPGDVGPQAVSDGARLAEFVPPRSAVDAASARTAH